MERGENGKGGKGEKGAREGIVPNPKQKSSCTSDIDTKTESQTSETHVLVNHVLKVSELCTVSSDQLDSV